MHAVIGLVFAAWLLCFPAWNSDAEVRQDDIQDAIARGVRFFTSQYNSSLGLLREAPRELDGIPYDHKYYLTNDNALAAYTLETLGAEPELAKTLRNSLAYYGFDHNGFIEVAWGEPIHWPPFHHLDVAIQEIGEDRILQETHDVNLGLFYDWASYSNLAFMAVLNEHNRGYHESALRLHGIEIASFDGRGWPDLAYDKRHGDYETLGAAWALYTGLQIGAPLEKDGPKLIEILLRQQGPEGGFYTHYRADADREALPNVETTSMALLALNAWAKRNEELPDRSVAIQRAVDFLESQYNPDPQVRLLRESPVVAPHKYWLATDNRLASWALEAANQITLAVTLSDTLHQRGDPRHGLIEALRGEIVDWPPHVETQVIVATVGVEQIWLETKLGGARFVDWDEYADLALYGALQACHQRDPSEARRRYELAMGVFDGIGFRDKAFRATGLHATFKLALAIYVARIIGEQADPGVLRSLMNKQAPPGASEMGMSYAGGFYTLYTADGVPVGDPNTETTAYAILALAPHLPYRCSHQHVLFRGTYRAE